jgi:hypothetical protein
MKVFVYSDEARSEGAGASRSFHDDDVISTLLAFWSMTPEKSDDILIQRSIPKAKKSFQYK